MDAQHPNARQPNARQPDARHPRFRGLRTRHLAAAILWILPLTLSIPAAAGELAEVGTIHADGTVEIYEDRFTSEISNGLPVAELRLASLAGGVWILRVGASGGDCTAEALPLWNDSGLLSPTNPGSSGDRLSVRPGMLWTVECEDAGCSEYRKAAGSPPRPVEASCEVPEDPAGPCDCRYPDSVGGGSVMVLGACEKTSDLGEILKLDHWIRPPWIELF